MSVIWSALSWAWSHPLDVAVWALLLPSLSFLFGGCLLAAWWGWRVLLRRMAE